LGFGFNLNFPRLTEEGCKPSGKTYTTQQQKVLSNVLLLFAAKTANLLEWFVDKVI